ADVGHGHAARPRQRDEDHPRHEIFLRLPVATPLLEHDRDDLGAVAVGERHVTTMVALLRPVAHQARRDSDAHASRLISAPAGPRPASATAVSGLQACSGSRPRNSTSAPCSYGTIASTKTRDPPGTRSRSAIAPLPPPVIASTQRRPEA